MEYINMDDTTVDGQDMLSQIGDIGEEAAAQEEAKQQVAKPEETNWRAMREQAEREKQARERAERERDELAKRLQERERQKQEEQEEYTPSLADDALVEGKHYSALHKELRDLKKEIKQYKQQTSENILAAQLKAQYSDFDKVVSRENIERLSAQYPDIARALGSSTDAYSAASSAYSLIKQLGIHEEAKETAINRESFARNASRPRSSQSVSPQHGTSPLNKVNEFVNDYKPTEEYLESLRKEMYASARRSS